MLLRSVRRQTYATVAASSSRKGTAAGAQFSMPKKSSKYEPILYDRHVYETKRIAVELDERERWLSQQYVEIMQNRAVVFLHSSGLPTADHKKLMRATEKVGMHMKAVNSRLFKGQLHGTQYQNMIPLLDGPTIVVWRQDEKQVDPKTGEEPSLHVDTVSFVKDFYKCFQTPAGRRLMVMGAKVDRHLLGPRELEAYARLPVKSQIHGVLVGTLQSPASRVLSLLQNHPSELQRILQEREKQLQPSQQQ